MNMQAPCAPSTAGPDKPSDLLSVVVPTYNESANVEQLAGALRLALHGQPYEILFVDDSVDETPSVLANLSRRDPAVRYNHRAGRRGLATAVVEGLRSIQGEMVAVMDADLQHPPEVMLRLIECMQRTGAEVVVASRYCPGGGALGLNARRKATSLIARWVAYLLLKEARATSDPLSGCFLIRRHVVHGSELRPVGWKILLEILVRGRYQHAVDVPYQFRERRSGKSKFGWREQAEYLRHLLILRWISDTRRRGTHC